MANPIRMLGASSELGFSGAIKGPLGQFGGLIAKDGTKIVSQTSFTRGSDGTPIWSDTATGSIDSFAGGLLTGISWTASQITVTANNNKKFTYDFMGGGFTGATDETANMTYDAKASEVIISVSIIANVGSVCRLVATSEELPSGLDPMMIGLAVGVVVLLIAGGMWYLNNKKNQEKQQTGAPPPQQQQQQQPTPWQPQQQQPTQPSWVPQQQQPTQPSWVPQQQQPMQPPPWPTQQ